VPAILVLAEYLDSNPAALADHITHHYNLNAPTATTIRGVLVDSKTHELGSALLAIAGALFFGLGFGRVLQLVHIRAWGIPLRVKQTDQGLYALVLLALFGIILLLLVQTKELAGGPLWRGLALAPGWVAVLLGYFLWAGRLLTHRRVAARDLLPGAAATAVGLVVVMIGSDYVMQFWVDFYAKDYGGLGVVMAIFFWIGLSSTIIVASASACPALAERRRRSRSG
jgi:membrane protein